MIDKTIEEIRKNRAWNPERWKQIQNQATSLSDHYRDVIRRKKESGDPVIHFAAYVVFDAMFGMHEVFSLMRSMPDRWDPRIVILPDLAKEYDQKVQIYRRCREYFVRLYGSDKVLDGWDIQNDRFIDYTDQFDMIYFQNPYDARVPEVHSISYASTKNVLPVYVNYGYDVGYHTMYARMKGPELNYVWKYFTETVYSLEDCKKLQVIQGKNVVLTGYAKMDALAGFPAGKKGQRKKILITAHHSFRFPELPLSNFLSCYKLILQLPEMFPDIDFVFRPHPGLFGKLILHKVWTKEELAAYLKALEEAGIEYSGGGEYLSLFAQCDAIINDCGSFTLEWLFTGKPGCFVMNENLKDEHLTTQMKEALSRYRIARNHEDIIRFISDVAAGLYPESQEMDDWVREKIAVNYPHVAEKILDEMDILNRDSIS